MKKSILIFSIVLVLIIAGGFIIKSQGSPSNNNVNNKTVTKSSFDETTSDRSEQAKAEISYEQVARMNEEGEVAVEIVFVNPIQEDKDYWIFEMALNTHSVNLEQYDYSKLITLLINDEKEYKEELIFETKGAGHHITHYIKMPKNIDGKSTITEDTKSITIHMKGIDDVPLRTFQWDITQLKSYIEI